jgi:hypothetical protein
MLTESERRVLATFCFNHQVATCRDCQRGLKLAATGVDIEGRRRYHHCPSCHADLTDSMRFHILTCKTISLALGDRVERSRRRIKESDLLNAASAVLAAESEERAQRAWRRRNLGGR